MKMRIKKILRFATYGSLLGIVSLFSFLVSKNKEYEEYSVTLNPLNDIPIAHADVPTGEGGRPGSSGDDGGDSGSGDSSDSSDSTM